MPDSLALAICQRLKAERQRLGLTQVHLSDLGDTTVQTIRRWEKHTPLPCDKLALLTHAGVDGLFVLTGQRAAATSPTGEAAAGGGDQASRRSLGHRLKEERGHARMTQKELAQRGETTVQTLRRWEKDAAMPCDKLARLAAAGLDVQYILTGRRTTPLTEVLDQPSPLDARLLAAVQSLATDQRLALLSLLETLLKK